MTPTHRFQPGYQTVLFRMAAATLFLVAAAGCSGQSRADAPQASGADEQINPAFGLTHEAQDPSERDKELGYGRWKAKPETEGTRSPTSPTRRRPD